MADRAPPRLLSISGSLRRGSYSTAVLRTLLDTLGTEAASSTFDIGTLPLYNADLDGENPPNPVRVLKTAIASAEALLFVTPEYNYGLPGVLKNAIDWASRPAYQSVLKDKPAAIISTSGGGGGARAQQQLKTTLLATLTRVLPWPEVLVTNAGGKVKDGKFIDEAGLALSLDLVRALLREVR
jgi:chromate reductase